MKERLRICPDSWIAVPDNVRYAASMYDGILKEVARTV